MLRLEKEVREQLSQRVHDVLEEYLSDVQARPVSSDFPPWANSLLNRILLRFNRSTQHSR
jgi:hypothetical protein